VERDRERSRDPPMVDFVEEECRDASSSSVRNVGTVKLEKAIDPVSSVEAIDSSYRRCSMDFPAKSLVGEEEREESPEDLGEEGAPRISVVVTPVALLRNTESE
jgi:hypothetical protein